MCLGLTYMFRERQMFVCRVVCAFYKMIPQNHCVCVCVCLPAFWCLKYSHIAEEEGLEVKDLWLKLGCGVGICPSVYEHVCTSKVYLGVDGAAYV